MHCSSAALRTDTVHTALSVPNNGPSQTTPSASVLAVAATMTRGPGSGRAWGSSAVTSWGAILLLLPLLLCSAAAGAMLNERPITTLLAGEPSGFAGLTSPEETTVQSRVLQQQYAAIGTVCATDADCDSADGRLVCIDSSPDTAARLGSSSDLDSSGLGSGSPYAFTTTGGSLSSSTGASSHTAGAAAAPTSTFGTAAAAAATAADPQRYCWPLPATGLLLPDDGEDEETFLAPAAYYPLSDGELGTWPPSQYAGVAQGDAAWVDAGGFGTSVLSCGPGEWLLTRAFV